MKVVHIGSNTTGGAGIGMMGVHKALLAAGVDSKVVTMRVNPGDENDPHIEIVTPPADFKDPLGPIVQGLRKKFRLPVSSPYSGMRIEDLPCVRDADVVHLHWISGLVNLETFLTRIDKPVVWTIRDENAMMGLYHFERERPVNPTDAERRIDEEIREKKVNWIRACKDLTYVSLCSGMKNRIDASQIGGRESFVIPNRIDTDFFKPGDRSLVRREFGIEDAETAILFVAQFLGEKRKGLRELFDALAMLVSAERRFTVLCVGHGKVEFSPPENIKVINAGPTDDKSRMAAFYAAADIFVTPSYSETFGKTTAEAIACGIPVVSFPNMGARDIIKDGVDGFLTDGFNSCAIARAIDRALGHVFDTSVMTARIRDRYSQKVIAEKHLELYRHIVDTPLERRVGLKHVSTPHRKRTESPRLSIITICYNNVDGLRETLWSTLHEQYGFEDFEQIVVDGGSKDGTVDALEEYKDRLGWYCSEPDKGIYDAMNKGAAHARGEYLLFLNSGDVLLTDMLKEAMREPFREDLVYSDIYFMTNGSRSLAIAPSMAEMTPGWFLFNSLPHQATFIRRDLHNRLGGYDATMRISAAPKFIFKALFELKCSYRKLDCIFSIFDRSGISSQPRMLRAKLQEWLDFLSPYYGKRVATIAMRWLTVSKVMDWEIYQYLRWHSDDFESMRQQIKDYMHTKTARDAAEKNVKSLKKLSIITVNKDNSAGLARTLASVLDLQDQSGDFEQIVVDGGSTDGSVAIMKKYGTRLAWSCSECDTGIYNAMNKGVRHAVGEYLLFLNSGDILKPDALKEFLALRSTEDIVYADIYVSDGKTERLSHQADLSELTPGWFLFNTLPHQAAFIRRALHLRLGGYDENLRISAAPKFFFEAVLKTKCSLRKLSKPFSVYDTRGISSLQEHHQEKVNDWYSFWKPYYGTWVADRAKERMMMIPDYAQLKRKCVELERQIKNNRKNLIELSRDVNSLKNSEAYRVGMFVTWPARRLYRMLKCWRENGLKYTLRRLLLGKGRGRK